MLSPSTPVSTLMSVYIALCFPLRSLCLHYDIPAWLFRVWPLGVTAHQEEGRGIARILKRDLNSYQFMSQMAERLV